MSGNTDLYVLSAVAYQLAKCLDTNELNILSAQLSALGDMLEVIAAQHGSD